MAEGSCGHLTVSLEEFQDSIFFISTPGPTLNSNKY